MKGIRILALPFLLTGCMDSSAYRAYYGDPEIVGSGPGVVQVKSGFNVDAASVAREYCEGPARLERTERLDQQGFYSVSYYSCS